MNVIFDHHTFRITTLYKLSFTFNAIRHMAGFPLEQASYLNVNQKHSYAFFSEIVYSVYLSNPIDKERISFLQPVIVEISGDDLIIKFTKVEKNVKSYFPEDRDPKVSGEENTEAEILGLIVNHFSNLGVVSANDFNVSIKKLWDTDGIDCHKIKYRDVHSTMIITMDETLTFKQQYPDKYKDMLHQPIGNSVWKNLLPEENMCDSFTCDPTDGKISINKFTEDLNQTSNVISKILAQN